MKTESAPEGLSVVMSCLLRPARISEIVGIVVVDLGIVRNSS